MTFRIISTVIGKCSFFVLCLTFTTLNLEAQIEPFGLVGRSVYSIASYGGKLYAGTDNGVYTHDLMQSDSSWIHVGLREKKVHAVYPHDFGAIGYAVTVGVERSMNDTTESLTYCSRMSDTSWIPTDSGIIRSHAYRVSSLDGFPSPMICGETFAVVGSKIYRRTTGPWEEVFDIGVGVVNVVRTNLKNISVWAGGETGILAPYITRSLDTGRTWNTVFPSLGGDNACYAFAFDPIDPAIVYAGMEGVVIKSTDAGAAWDQTGLNNTSYYFFGLAISHRGELFAGGASNSKGFGLFLSADGGGNWNEIAPQKQLPGISSLVITPTTIPEMDILYIGTLGDGVYRLKLPITSVEPGVLPGEYAISQNYPNPFSGATNIEFQLPIKSRVTLKVFDVLGREVAVLINGNLQAGSHNVRFNTTGLSEGTYFYTLISNGFRKTKAMHLLKR